MIVRVAPALVALVGLAACSDSAPADHAGDTSTFDVRPADSADLDAPDIAVEVEPDPACEGDTRPPRTAIVNGREAPTLVPVRPAQLLAVVQVLRGPAGCSGVLVTPRWALTAAHCLRDSQPADLAVRFGDGRNPSLETVDVDSVHIHSERDLALVHLSRLPEVDVEPVPIHDGPPQTWLDRPVELAGFGVALDELRPGRLFAVERVVNATDEEIEVDGERVHGACLGDSGGPLLGLAADATVRVVGVLSGGDTSCVGRDRYARVDTDASWATALAGPPLATPAPCGPVGEAGRCDGAMAIFCENDDLVTEICAPERSCGFSGGGFRCLEAPDPCQGIDSFGLCQEGRARWCDGALRERDCDSCDRVCAIVDGLHGVDCIAPVCDGLDGAGECRDHTARYCLAGALHEDDCAALESTCQDGRCACGPHGSTPTCSGSLRLRCNGRFLEVENCASDGLTCSGGACR